jgi:FkbM family methyltransferase
VGTKQNLRRRILAPIVVALPSNLVIWSIARLHRRIEAEMKSVVNACDPNGIVIDVGAWYGPWTYWLSKRSDSVVAFEPNPRVAEILSRGRWKNVDVRRQAASDSSGRAQLFMTGAENGLEGQSSLIRSEASQNEVEVEVVAIDDLEFDPVRLIKIDVEGAEHGVLLGAERTINSQWPVLVIEIEDVFGSIEPTIGLLRHWGYEARCWVDSAWTMFDSEQFISDQRDFLRSKAMPSYLSAAMNRGYGYRNDVVFVHPRSTWSPWSR